MKKGYVYILANIKDNVLYTGVTSDLVKRIYEHKRKLVDGFTRKYNVDKLVYYQVADDIEAAIAREKQIKSRSRKRKVELIRETNPGFDDLYDSILDCFVGQEEKPQPPRNDGEVRFARNDSAGKHARNDSTNKKHLSLREAKSHSLSLRGAKRRSNLGRTQIASSAKRKVQPPRKDGGGRPHRIDSIDRKLLLALQEGLPIAARPYEELARKVGISEKEIISRLSVHKKTGLLKRIDFRLDLKKIGLVGTLVACRIPSADIPKAKEIILKCKNVTHNYLRRDGLNMWFTLNAPSAQRLHDILTDLKERLGVKEMLSFKTKKTFKLRFRLDVN